METSFWGWLHNPSFWAAFCGWGLAQFTKLIGDLRKTRRVNFYHFVSVGGMPSAHSAMVSALTVSIGINRGFESTVFVLALAFALITMFDASTVRRAAGQQARLLNQIVEELFRERRLAQEKLRELLGHTRLEVFMGMLMGVFTALLVNAVAMARRG